MELQGLTVKCCTTVLAPTCDAGSAKRTIVRGVREAAPKN